MSRPYGSGLGWLCWRGVWGISQGPPHFLAHLASLFARWALWLELQVGVEVHQQGWVVALPDMDVGQHQMKRGEVALAGAGFAGAFLRSVHLIQPHQGTRQLELAVPGVAIQLESSAREWFGNSWRSEEHTSELQSRENLVCRLLLEKKNKINTED